MSSIVDMHVHTFNLRYLPLEGILHSRKLPKPLPKLLDELLVSKTGDYGNSRALDATAEVSLFQQLETLDAKGLYGVLFSKLSTSQDKEQQTIYQALVNNERELDAYIADIMEEELEAQRKSGKGIAYFTDGNSHESVATLTGYFVRFGQEIEATKALNENASKEELKSYLAKQPLPSKILAVLRFALNVPGNLEGFYRFLRILMMAEDQMVRFMSEREYPQVDLFVSHMMDMEKTYNDTPALPFREQISRNARLQEEFQEKLIIFGAFDPFRRGDALEEVEAAKNMGVRGIKFYPPSGYRPADNEIPPKPKRSIWQRIWDLFSGGDPLTAQWNSRYKDYNKTQLDKINEKFFEYARENNLIIFSHHTPEGFESVPDYGTLFAEPRYWAPVLQKYPELKLILAHSGGETGWLGNMTGTYSQQAYNLCVLYENVYCDMGFFDGIFNGSNREKLRANLLQGLSNPMADRADRDLWARLTSAPNNRESAPWIYPITSKIMYGTDWTMVSRLEKRRQFVDAFEAVFTGELACHRDSFFSSNAKKILFE